MSWYEVKVLTNSLASSAILEFLNELGSEGTALEDPNDPVFKEGQDGSWDYFDHKDMTFEFDGALAKGYFETDAIEEIVEALDEAMEALKGFGLDPTPGQIKYKEIFEKDWANEWKKFFKPIRIGDKLVIKPTWEAFEAGDEDLVIEIDPGGAFGSGTHETTSLCMEFLEKQNCNEKTVYDIGCGSGILGVTAAKLGAKKVIAGDIDPVAVETSIENALLNHVEDIVFVKEGDLLTVAEGKADIIVANIIADIIIMMLPDVKKILSQDGVFISSGIIDFKLDDVIKALQNENFDIVEIKQKGSWAAVEAKLG